MPDVERHFGSLDDQSDVIKSLKKACSEDSSVVADYIGVGADILKNNFLDSEEIKRLWNTSINVPVSCFCKQLCVPIFVERSSTIERYCQPPPPIWKRFAYPLKHFLLQLRSSSRNCDQFTSVVLKMLIYKCNLQASLNHRANACSCLCT
jgi:hypothetical protein